MKEKYLQINDELHLITLFGDKKSEREIINEFIDIIRSLNKRIHYLENINEMMFNSKQMKVTY